MSEPNGHGTDGDDRVQVLIAAAGSTGDVVPFVGLAVQLRQAGFRVSVASYAEFAALVREQNLEFRELPGDQHAMDHSAEGMSWQEGGGGIRSTVRFLKMMSAHMRELHEGLAAVAGQGADVLLLSGFLSLGGYPIGQALGIPTASLHLQPVEPTGDYPPPGLPRLGRWGNLAAWNAVMTAGVSTQSRPLKQLRAELGLPAASYRSVRREQQARRWPLLYGFSPLISPPASDWRPGVEVTGYWWPPRRPDWQPPQELVNFLQAGPPPVYVGFGSRSFRNGERITDLVTAALRQAKVRGVVQAGWAGLTASGDDIITIDEVPHDWLFPQMAALVHHAGAGTTGAGLRAGVPAIGIPVIADQPFWCARLRALGVSPGSVPFKQLTAERLASLIRQATENPDIRQRAETVSHAIRAEDSTEPVIHTITRLLDTA